MIGKTYKSWKVLLKSLDDKRAVEYVTLLNSRVYGGALLRLGDECLNFISYSRGYSHKSPLWSKEMEEIVQKLLDKYSYVEPFDNFGIPPLFNQAALFIIVPSTIEDDIEKVVNNNKKQFAQIYKYGKLTSQSPLMKLTYVLTNGNATYMTWLIKNFYLCNVSIHASERIMNFIQRYPQLISRLNKKNIIAYNGITEIKQLLGEIHSLTCEKRVNQVINTFNTQQKRLLKALPKDKNLLSSFSKFEQLSPKKQQNFIRKVSTMDDANDILKHLAFLTSQHFHWSKESVMEFIHNVNEINCDVVLDRDGIVLFRVHDFETVKRLGKTTNWCISKNKSYWKSYIGAHVTTSQYILMDFNKEEDDEYSIVGFTINNREGIVAAHSFTNQNLLPEKVLSLTEEDFPVSIFNVIKPRNIELLLKGYNICISDLNPSNETKLWSEEIFFNELSKHTNDDYDIIGQPEDGVFFLRIDNDKWKTLFKDKFEAYYRNPNGSYILYLNFNLDANDNQRMLFVTTRINRYHEEEVVSSMIDSNCNLTSIRFDSLLKKHNMAYDTLKRVNTLHNRFENYCNNIDIEGLKELIESQTQELDSLPYSKIRQLRGSFENLLQQSLYNFSPSVVELLLLANKPLCISCGVDLIRNIGNRMTKYSGYQLIENILPFTDDEIEELKKHPKEINPMELRGGVQNVVCIRFYLWVLQKIVYQADTSDILSWVVDLLNFGASECSMDIILSTLLQGLGDHKVDNKTLQKIVPKLHSFPQAIEALSDLSNVEWDKDMLRQVLSYIRQVSPYFTIIKNKCEAL